MSVNYSPPLQPGLRPMPAPSLPLEVWGATDKGRERESNEDALYPHSGADTFPFKPSAESLARRGQMLAIADGVGGARAGSEASRWVIRVAVERYYDLSGPNLGADLRTAIEIANASLYRYLQSTGTYDAASTMAAAVIHGDILYVANVGDSRVYLIRDGEACQLTHDHTLTQRKIDQGLIPADQAELDTDRSVLTRSLGSAPTVLVDLLQPRRLAPGDRVLLCSDGLSDMLTNAEIARLADGPPKRAVRRLIAAANRRGGFDNISVVIARVGGEKPGVGRRATGGFARLLPHSIRAMSRRQQIVLLLLVMGMVCSMSALGWVMRDRARNRPDTIEATIPTPTVTPTQTPAVAPIAVPTNGTVAPTSTPAPTLTPTPSPTPRRPPTATPTPPPTDTPMPTPATGGGGDGGEQPTPPPTATPEKPTPPPPEP